MSAVDFDFPVIVHTLRHGRLEAEIDDGIDEKIDEIELVGVIHTFSHVQDTVQCGGRIHPGLLF